MTSTHSSLIGQVCSAGSKLLVQSTVFDKFIGKLKTRLGHFRIGHSLDKTIDMAAIVDESQRRSVAEFVEEARGEGAEVIRQVAGGHRHRYEPLHGARACRAHIVRVHNLHHECRPIIPNLSKLCS